MAQETRKKRHRCPDCDHVHPVVASCLPNQPLADKEEGEE